MDLSFDKMGTIIWNSKYADHQILGKVKGKQSYTRNNKPNMCGNETILRLTRHTT